MFGETLGETEMEPFSTEKRDKVPCSPVDSTGLPPGSVDLTQCDVLYKDLSKGLESLMLNSHLHLLYLVTPYDMIAQCKPDWMAFFRQVGARGKISVGFWWGVTLHKFNVAFT